MNEVMFTIKQVPVIAPKNTLNAADKTSIFTSLTIPQVKHQTVAKIEIKIANIST